jgi:filamentous hemagglutinin
MADKGGGKSYRKDRERKKSLGKKPSGGAAEPEMSPTIKSQNQPGGQEPEQVAMDTGTAEMEKEAAERKEQEKERMEKEKEEREKLEQEQQLREQQEKEQQEREQLDLYIQETQARLNWKQSLRSANIEAAANRYGRSLCPGFKHVLNF